MLFKLSFAFQNMFFQVSDFGHVYPGRCISSTPINRVYLNIMFGVASLNFCVIYIFQTLKLCCCLLFSIILQLNMDIMKCHQWSNIHCVIQHN